MAHTHDDAGRVYLLWAEGTQSFKIGYTGKSARHRAYTLSHASPVPLRIVGDVPGGRSLELRHHRRLAAYRTHGEWFALPERVLRVVLTWFGYDVRSAFAPNKEHADSRP